MGKRIKKMTAYQRVAGKESAKPPKTRGLSFCFTQQCPTQGQRVVEWEKDGLLADLIDMTKVIGKLSVHEAKQKFITEYAAKPPHSEFSHPKHIGEIKWASFHIKPNSQAVIIGYIDYDNYIFYVVFLDRYHKFWPTEKKGT
jgi:hypothetical protein